MAVFLIFFGFPTLFAVLGWGKKRKNETNSTNRKEGEHAMKKIFIFLLTLVMMLSLVSCGEKDTDGGKEKTTSDAIVKESVKEEDADLSDASDDKIDAQEVVEKALEEAEELNSFSVEAVERWLKNAAGIELSAVEPDWEWKLKNEYCAYGDDPASSGYGHAAIIFTKAEGEVSDQEIDDYFAKVFAATAAASDDGYNIIGYEFVGEGEDALAETTLEAALDSWMPGWGFRYNGTLMAVYVNSEYDNDKESELDRLFYYDGVQIDIGVGLQKSFDDSWDEMEEYFEENEEEIKEALEDYVG